MATSSVRSSKACHQCRAAKIKCDGQFPTCSSCLRRGLNCQGLPPSREVELSPTFHIENEAARLASLHAREGRRRERPSVIPLEVAQQPMHQAGNVESNLAITPLQQPFAGPSAPLPRDPATRVVERFFVDWTQLSREDGASAGKEQELPMLYSNAAEGSTLSLAVRTMATAHVESAGMSEALQLYGLALSSLRVLIENHDAIIKDDSLVAILLLDTFETLHWGYKTPLGSHSEVIAHITRERAKVPQSGQFQLSFWRTAQHRLLFRQLVLAEETLPEQDLWFEGLDNDIVNFAVSRRIHALMKLSRAAQKLLKEAHSTWLERAARMEQVLKAVADLLTSLDAWEDSIPAFKKLNESPIVSTSSSMDTGTQNRGFASFGPRSIWIAYLAAQIVARDSIIQLLESANASQHDSSSHGSPSEPSAIGSLGHTQSQRSRVQDLCRTMLAISQQILDLLKNNDNEDSVRRSPQTNMAIKSSVYMAVEVARKSRSSLEEQRQVAEELLETCRGEV